MSKLAQVVSFFSGRIKPNFADKSTIAPEENVKSNGTENAAGNLPHGTESEKVILSIVPSEESGETTSPKPASGDAEETTVATSAVTIPDLNGQDSAHRLARLLQALDDCDKDFSNIRADYKARRETLQNQIWILRSNILNGQAELPLEN